MFNRNKTTKLILYASPLGTLVAGAILFGHPTLSFKPVTPPVQLVSIEAGKTAEAASQNTLIQPTAIQNATPVENFAALDSPLPQLAALPANPIPFEDGYPEPASNANVALNQPKVEKTSPAERLAALDLSKPAAKAARSDGAPLYTAIVEDAKPPKGWKEFCAEYPGECNAKTSSPREITLTTDAWDTIVGVNNWANKHIKPTTDMKHWGRVNKWYYADDGRGDCKDYVLVKQRKLIEAGFPREALLIAIVWTKQNQGHAVLLVRTDKGEFALDNLSKEVRLWSKTPYDYVKRQTRTNPNAWVYIDGDPRKPSAMAANDIR
jgi:predicted transglutaminase-like cysteine proteinase